MEGRIEIERLPYKALFQRVFARTDSRFVPLYLNVKASSDLKSCSPLASSHRRWLPRSSTSQKPPVERSPMNLMSATS